MENIKDSIENFNLNESNQQEIIENTIPVFDDVYDDGDEYDNNIDKICGVIKDDEITEYFEDEEDLRVKGKKLAKLIKKSKHFVVYTGAGISTNAGIPDYRGPKGVWTLKAQNKAPQMKVNLTQAIPTYSHMALVRLMEEGLLKFVVSTNCDGLHRRSGIPEDSIAEVHGNIFREYCVNPSCSSEFLRPFDVRPHGAKNFIVGKRHTGRLCERVVNEETGEQCCGKLRDSIVNFGEYLPKRALSNAINNSKAADLTLVMGSSMRVEPAASFPSYSYEEGGKFCIINLQKTPFDEEVAPSKGIRIFSKCDEIMRIVMEELDIEVNPYVYEEDEVKNNIQNMIIDEDFYKSPLSKYNVISMADEPLPDHILSRITDGFKLKKVKVNENRCGVELGKVME